MPLNNIYRFYQNAYYQDAILPKCLLPKCPITEMSCYRNVPYQNVHYQSVLYQNVWIPTIWCTVVICNSSISQLWAVVSMGHWHWLEYGVLICLCWKIFGIIRCEMRFWVIETTWNCTIVKDCVSMKLYLFHHKYVRLGSIGVEIIKITTIVKA